MKESDFYRSLEPSSNKIQCTLCSHQCKILNNQTGLCKVRKNENGKLLSLVYGSLVSQSTDPVEKKPVFHLEPGSLSYSIATVGCNFQCHHCQNHQISQYPLLNPGVIPGTQTSPELVVQKAISHKCKSVSFTYIEPTIFFEFAYDISILAHQNNIKTIFVSNGYTSRQATKKIAPYLDANNIDLKSFSNSFYKEVCNAKLSPVLETIQLMKESGVWVEVTTLVIPGLNDSDKELKSIAQFIAGVSPEIPWHVSKFHPTYKMNDRQSTPAATLHRARDIGKAEGLQYIYTGNIPGQGGENTYCPTCSNLLIERIGYQIIRNDLINGNCPSCASAIPGIW